MYSPPFGVGQFLHLLGAIASRVLRVFPGF